LGSVTTQWSHAARLIAFNVPGSVPIARMAVFDQAEFLKRHWRMLAWRVVLYLATPGSER
ncbi:MAG: hypothetical protein WB793_01375, partial [Candidatus Dormiibacterota bacterium]